MFNLNVIWESTIILPIRTAWMTFANVWHFEAGPILDDFSNYFYSQIINWIVTFKCHFGLPLVIHTASAHLKWQSRLISIQRSENLAINRQLFSKKAQSYKCHRTKQWPVFMLIIDAINELTSSSTGYMNIKYVCACNVIVIEITIILYNFK